MENNNSLVQELEKEEKQELDGVPVCGANLSSPVTNIANFIDQIHYKIGTRIYIENAD
jgi:hypothetical protein